LSDVACVCSAPIIREVRARGLDPLPLVAGLDLCVADLEDLRGRIPWHAFVVFAERAEKTLGRETLEDLAAAATVEYVPAPIRRVLPLLRDSRRLFTLAARWWGPWVFQGTRGRCEKLPDGRLREIVEILPEYAACPEFLSGIRGTLRAMPRLLDQPDALVTLEQDGRQGEFLITPPPPRARSAFGRGWLGRGRGWGARRRLARAESELEELGFSQEQLLETKRRAEWMAALLDERSSRFDALQQLGLTLVRTSDLESLEQEIVRLVQQQLGATGVRLSQHGGDRPARETTAGRPVGPPAQALPLRVADDSIGLLEIWGVAPKDRLAPVHDFLPWIAIALQNSGSKALVARLLRLLADDERDWRRMKRRLKQVLAELRDAPSPVPEHPAEQGTAGPGIGRDLETIDLGQLLHALAPRLRRLVGSDVPLELRCADGLSPALPEPERLAALVADVVELLADLGSEEIRIEARAAAEPGYPTLEPTAAEILVRGRGRGMAAVSSSRLLAALDLSGRGPLAGSVDARSDADGGVRVRVRLPLLGPAASGWPH
jgi:hypothetical protein